MKKIGKQIQELRRQKGLTQAELAEQLGVTDKAVSKWERDLSYPDVELLPRLALLFDTTVDELLQAKVKRKILQDPLHIVVLRALAVAMGVALFVCGFLVDLTPNEVAVWAGLGIFSLALLSCLKGKDTPPS